MVETTFVFYWCLGREVTETSTYLVGASDLLGTY